MPSPEPLDTSLSVSAFLLRPLRSLPEFAAELRCRLDRVPVSTERASLARMLTVAECEIGQRQPGRDHASVCSRGPLGLIASIVRDSHECERG
jgi:hypothetical protein